MCLSTMELVGNTPHRNPPRSKDPNLWPPKIHLIFSARIKRLQFSVAASEHPSFTRFHRGPVHPSTHPSTRTTDKPTTTTQTNEGQTPSNLANQGRPTPYGHPTCFFRFLTRRLTDEYRRHTDDRCRILARRLTDSLRRITDA